jgi:hypothetical protein
LFFVPADDAGKTRENAFTWTLVLQNEKTGDTLPVSIPVKSANGERFRLIINTEADCYVYVIAEISASRDVLVLHANPLKRDTPWFSPVMVLSPQSGRESLYVITSRNEQAALAQRINDFTVTNSTVHRRALINEVFRIRNEVSQFKENSEKPMLIKGASIRDIYGKNEGLEFFGMATYVKTISIEH